MGTFDPTFEHHTEAASLMRSREAGCTICTALANDLQQELDLLDDQPISIIARLRKVKYGQPPEHIYHLDFELEKKRTRLFVLKPTDSMNLRLRTSKSLNTSSDEVFDVAHKWISEFRCADSLDKPGEKWYPKRLLDLDELRNANGLQALDSLTFLSEHANIERTRVRLVETNLALMLDKKNGRYVTLSHCWGKPKSVQGQLKLNSRTEKLFKTDGIELRELPKSFRDAMLFACLLENVGYIWIDSLCIKQPATGVDCKDSEQD